MEPFSMIKDTGVKIFSLENNDATLVVATTDTSRPDAPAQTQYEECENDAESQAVLQKFIFDLQRQGWHIEDEPAD